MFTPFTELVKLAALISALLTPAPTEDSQGYWYSCNGDYGHAQTNYQTNMTTVVFTFPNTPESYDPNNREQYGSDAPFYTIQAPTSEVCD